MTDDLKATIELVKEYADNPNLWGVTGQLWERFRQDLRHLIAAAEREHMTDDDPEFDATDAAHPAWWRGEHHATAALCEQVMKVLDGETAGVGSNEPWASTRKRLIEVLGNKAARDDDTSGI